MKLLIYCTKTKPILSEIEYCYGDEMKTKYECISDTKKGNEYLEQMGLGEFLNGKIVGECDFEVEEITYNDNNYYFEYMHAFETLRKSCLSFTELDNYLKQQNGYAIHIKNLKVFNEPRELRFYYQKYKNDKHLYNVEKSPQNMMKVIGKQGEKYILISIHPEWICKILNGEKTIEVRKKVLKEMKNEN